MAAPMHLGCHSRENGNPDPQHRDLWIPVSALNIMWCRASAGMTDPKDTHLTFRNLRICQKYRENRPLSMKIGLIWTDT